MFYSDRKKIFLKGLLGYTFHLPNNADDLMSLKTSPYFPNFKAIWILILLSRTRGTARWFSLPQLFVQISEISWGRKNILNSFSITAHKVLQGSDPVLCISLGHEHPLGIRNTSFQTAVICL